MKVRIVQLLCPQRHAVVAFAYESETGEALPEKTDEFKVRLAAAYANHLLNPWCGICRSQDLRYEDEATIFKTLETAMPFLRELEQRQAATRKFFESGRN